MRFGILGLFGLLSAAICCPASGQEFPHFRILKLDGHAVRWEAPANVRVRVVTYRILSEPAEFQRARNCRKMTNLEGLVAGSGLSAATVGKEIAAAFAMWERAANLLFQEAPEGTAADILIGAQIEPDGWAFADVFYDVASPEAIKPISKALVCLNPLRRWKVGFDGDLKSYDIRYTIAHEIGHAIGLDHPQGGGQIMGYRYEESFRSLQPGDIRGAILLYGAPRQYDAAVAAGSQEGLKVTDSESPSSLKHGGTRGFTARSR